MTANNLADALLFSSVSGVKSVLNNDGVSEWNYLGSVGALSFCVLRWLFLLVQIYN